MAGRAWAGASALLVLGLAVGCGNDKSSTKGAGGAGSGASGTGGSATSGGSGGSGDGPAITSAPPAWVAPADCGGIGNLCPNLSGCAAKSSCQLIGNVCIPMIQPNMPLPSKSADRPYCAAFTCMTFDEASCFCTGDAGKTVPECVSPSALAGLCAATGVTCDQTPCCDGLSCVSNGSGSKLCQKTCSTNADCPDTGCCTDPNDVGTNICTAKAACDNPCKKEGDTTCTPGTATTASNCCRGSCVQSTEPDFAGCRPNCNTTADCTTGCCSPFSNSSSGFCAAPAYCTDCVKMGNCACVKAGGTCGQAGMTCCDGTACAGVGSDADGGAFQCYPTCKTAQDCATNCCQPLTGTAQSICLDALYCQAP